MQALDDVRRMHSDNFEKPTPRARKLEKSQTWSERRQVRGRQFEGIRVRPALHIRTGGGACCGRRHFGDAGRLFVRVLLLVAH